MIHVELVGGEEHGGGTYTATAEFEAPVESTDAAESRVHTLTDLCAQQWIDAVDSPGRIEAVTVTLSSECDVQPTLEDRLTDRWDIDDVSLRYGGPA